MLTPFTPILWVLWGNTAATNLILFKIKAFRIWHAIDNLFDLIPLAGGTTQLNLHNNEEAKAIIEANENRADVEFGHVKAGNGGLIQFFPEHLEVAKKYRSTTRLLRKD